GQEIREGREICSPEIALPIRRLRVSEAPRHRVLGMVGADKPGAEGVSEMAAELRVRGADPVENAANLVGDRLAHAFGRITHPAGTTAESVCRGELLADHLDFMPSPRRLSEVPRRGRPFEFLAGFSQ